VGDRYGIPGSALVILAATLTAIPAIPVVGLVLVRDHLSAAIFQGGKFSHEDVQKVGFVLAMYAPAIWAYSMQQLATRAFYAVGDSTTPVPALIT
jgi:peptidoglycan biosynthesis protein MviN/MurJ (putative lipid II flippase)